VTGRTSGPPRWRRRAALAAIGALVAALATPVAPAADAPPALLDFSADERQRILRHGPWPPSAARDPGNAQAGQPAAIALGRRLFFDPRLSPDGRLACASCHAPHLAFADGRARAAGREPLARNTPSLWNAVHGRWWGWDGAFDSLWSQALHPLGDPREMAASAGHLQALMAGDRALACAFRQTYGALPGPDAEITRLQLAKALGAFVGSLVSGPTPFDAFRDALARGDRRAAAR
jgi:cytochrome c peroxidase